MSYLEYKTKAVEAETAFKAGLEEWDLIVKKMQETGGSPATHEEFRVAADKLSQLHIALLNANRELRMAEEQEMKAAEGGSK